MKILDITVDLETTALCPTAAVLSIGAVAWDMAKDDTPFFLDGNGVMDFGSYFSVHIDPRRMIIDNFTIDTKTQEWWSQQSEEAKKTILASDSEDAPSSDIKDAISDLFAWIETAKEQFGYDAVNLWSQGTDFDIAILRNICYKYNIDFPVCHKFFCDHRSVFMQNARAICIASGAEFYPPDAYKMVEPYDGDGVAHDPIYDCKRSIWSTWQMMNYPRCLNIDKKK